MPEEAGYISSLRVVQDDPAVAKHLYFKVETSNNQYYVEYGLVAYDLVLWAISNGLEIAVERIGQATSVGKQAAEITVGVAKRRP